MAGTTQIVAQDSTTALPTAVKQASNGAWNYTISLAAVIDVGARIVALQERDDEEALLLLL